LTGQIEQRPPSFSALKIAGQRAYDLARAGEEVELAPRNVQIYRLRIVRYEYPELALEIECSGGTYVRSLGRDLAERAGTGAVMASLVRTAIGPFTLAQAVDPEMLSFENLAGHLLPPILAVRGRMAETVLSPQEIDRVAHGLPIRAAGVEGDRCAALDAHGRLAAILGRRAGDEFRAIKNFPVLE
jgi:tRNA pseudouridine55 synthase